MLNKVLFLVFFVVLLNGKQLYNNPKEYMIINKEDWILGVVKLDINFNNGEFGSTFGFFLDEDTIITSSAITSLGFPLDINVKIKDDNADLIICIAKARLLASDTNRSLAMLKIKNYTDDYCNYSNEKIYHQELIRNQKIQIPNYTKPAKKDIVSLESPFFYKNCIHTMSVEQGMPYFDNEYNLIGISSNNKIIAVNEIINFINDIHLKRLQ